MWYAPALENLLSLARTDGDVVSLPQFDVPYYLFNHPEQIEEILRRKPELFKKATFLTALRPLLGEGLFTSEGETWRRHRVALQPLFLARQVRHHAPAMVDATIRMLSTWQPGETRDCLAEIMRLALEIVIRAQFDFEVSELVVSDLATFNNKLDKATSFYTDPRSVWSSTDDGTSSVDSAPGSPAAELHAIVSDVIDKRKTAGPGNRTDLLSRLLLVTGPDGSKFSDAEVRDEIVTTLIAGQETTALTITYAFCLLSQNPDAEASLMAELNRVLGERPPAAADVVHLQYANAVIKDSMRLFPPAWALGREALEDCEIGGHAVPKGSQLLMSQFVVHRDPRFWCDPERFNPSRWISDEIKKLPRCAYFPFGDGPRVCIGANLASLESVLLLATIAQRFRLELVEELPLCLVPSLTLRPHDGVRMRIHPRCD
jgi:cytochrome P450